MKIYQQKMLISKVIISALSVVFEELVRNTASTHLSYKLFSLTSTFEAFG